MYQTKGYTEEEIEAAKALLLLKYGPAYYNVFPELEKDSNLCHNGNQNVPDLNEPEPVIDSEEKVHLFDETMEISQYVEDDHSTQGPNVSKSTKLQDLEQTPTRQPKAWRSISVIHRLNESGQIESQDEVLHRGLEYPLQLLNGEKLQKRLSLLENVEEPLSSSDESKENLVDLDNSSLNSFGEVEEQSPRRSSQEPSTSTNKSDQENAANVDIVEEDEELIALGPNDTKIPKRIYDSISWEGESKATRGLLRAIFSREILATHTLSGLPSPAFRDRKMPRKGKLDPVIVADIVDAVSKRLEIPRSDVRKEITIACSDESKLYRMEKARKKMAMENGSSPPRKRKSKFT